MAKSVVNVCDLMKHVLPRRRICDALVSYKNNLANVYHVYSVWLFLFLLICMLQSNVWRLVCFQKVTISD